MVDGPPRFSRYSALVLPSVGPIHKAGTVLGKLTRTLYLCDLLSNLSFRCEVYGILEHGESIHYLQRAINPGALGPRKGRRQDELIAISGALTLLANLVMAWNTAHMQRVTDRWLSERNPYSRKLSRTG